MFSFIALLTIFVLAIFIGFEVITKVPPTLHTPLMSGSNAISGITIVGALILAGNSDTPLAQVLAGELTTGDLDGASLGRLDHAGPCSLEEVAHCDAPVSVRLLSDAKRPSLITAPQQDP